jgi:membrane glycosyltransferase
MTMSSDTAAPSPPADLARVEMTPAGIQSLAELSRRRLLITVLNVVTWLGLAALMATILGNGGWTTIDVVMFVCFLIGTPWTVLGFWNAAIGLWLLLGTKDPVARTAPFAAAGEADTPITVRTAIFMTVRNEDPARALARLEIVKRSVDATGHGGHYSYFVLSDTSDANVAAEEEAAFAAFKARVGDAERLIYRRRTSNEGYKAGNVRDFCERYGRDFDLMLPLDADSLMTGDAIVKLTRICQAYPKLGILQSLVVGMPTDSAFARIFQFGMRHGMRSYTMGSAWWIGDCGPFWGHNAMVRIKPFMEDCHLPKLPGGPPLGGHVLSHDQVEATFMRRAGYEVRVLPVEMGSYEENPPTILEFTRRDTRWCQGNMQYWALLGTPGLLPMSRFQLAWAILMFLGTPAWTLFIALGVLKPFQADVATFPTALAITTYLLFLSMYLSPKIAGFVDILASSSESRRYGGRPRFVAGAAVELVFSFLVGAVSTFRVTLFMIGLIFGKSITWNGQARDAHGIPWSMALNGMWPQLLFGSVVIGLAAVASPLLLAWGLIMVVGYVLAIPFGVLTAEPWLGRVLARWKLCAIPEEFDTPADVAAVRGKV